MSAAALSESITDVVLLAPVYPEFMFSNLYKFIELILRSAADAPDSDRGIIFYFTPPAIIGSPKVSTSLAYFNPKTGILVDYWANTNLLPLPNDTAGES